MDRSKATGDYASAYKLSRSTKDTKERLHRRSLEWKEIRRGQADRRRNINTDLSPVLEGEQTLQRDKSYSGKTPTKATKSAATGSSAKKTNDRMDMLKKWKAEREQKKKEELQAKKGSVFRVSKNIDHKDTSLFKKSQPLKNAVKPVAAPIKPTGPSKPVYAPTKHSVVPTKPAPVVQTHEARNKASHKTDTKTQHQTADKTQARAGQAHGSLKALGKTSMLKKPHSPKAASAQSQKGRSTRSSAQQVTGKAKEAVSHAKAFEQPQPTTRVSRSQTRSQAIEPAIKKTQGKEPVAKPEKTKAPGKLAKETPAAEPIPSEAPADHSISLSKVTLRGSASDSMESFAPSDCTFTAPANLTSFVFKPLSPASAASFLFPNQESSTSFLETKPNRASTPKSADKEKENTDVTTADKTVTQETVVKEAEEKEIVSPVKTRSKRRSVGSTVDSSSENETSILTPARSSRRTRASVLPTVSETDTNSESEVPEVEKNMIATPSQSAKRPRRSLRRSVIMNSLTEQPVSSEEELGSPAKRRRSSRRSVTSVETQDVEVVNESKNKDSSEKMDTKTPPRSSRRSSRKSNICEVSEEKMEVEETIGESEQTESNTPSRSRRKSVRKSSANQTSEERINQTETEQNKTETLDDKNTVSTPNSVSDSKTEGGTAKRAARAKFFNSSSKENTTPARQKGRAARKSFGGFAMPDSNSCVLSAKRKARKSMMPKSPEEWVDLLSHSPMVEMTRRTPKTSATKSPNGSIPPLNFDDIDLENLPPQPVFTSPSAKEGSAGSEPTVSESPVRDRMTHGRSPTASPKPGTSGVESFSHEAISPCSERRRTRSVSSGAASPGQGSVETVPKIAEETLQVEEISSTLDSHLSDDIVRVRYFRDLLSSESERLRKLCKVWDDYNNFTEDLTEEARGQIRTVIGQAVLLMNERFKQFSGLVDNCEFKTGEKETTVTDLQGFWDMIYFQVEDVTIKFERLEKLQKNNWVDDKPEPVKKVVKKKVAKPAAPKLNVKSKFAAFRAQMKKQQVAGSPVAQKEEEKVFEVPGFFKVASPVKSPRPHCEAGTPKKAMQPVDATDSCAKDNLKVPSDQPGSEELLKRTPARKSYVPAVPSPLLQDSTPLPRPVRSCTKKTPIPKRLLEETDSAAKTEVNLPDSPEIEADTGKGKKTPKRRSLRPRKSVTFNEKVDSALGDSVASMTIDSPINESSDADFARLLQPMTALQETNIANEADDSFSKYLQPSKSLNVSVEKENTPKQETGRRRRPSLKSTKSSEKRRSRAQSVHFVSPVREQESSQILPHTPFNRDSLVKQKRVTRHSGSSATKVDVFDIENIDSEDNMLPSFGANSKRSARPSLLYTPPHIQKLTPSNKNVPTATLISFSP